MAFIKMLREETWPTKDSYAVFMQWFNILCR